MLELETIVAKSELPGIAERRGSLNDEAVTIDGTEYAPGTLVQRGFAGAYSTEDRLFHGCLRYDQILASTVAVSGDLTDVSVEPGVITDESEE